MKSLIGLFGCVLLGAVTLFAAAPTGIEIRKGGGSVVSSGGGTNIYTNSIYVNNTGTRYEAATALTNAIQSASSGSLVIVGPGWYELRTNETSLTMKHGVDQYWMPGAKFVVGISNTIQNMFDDSSGALTSSIYGYGEFYLTNAAGGGSILYLSGNGSKVRFQNKEAKTWSPGGDVINADGAVTIDATTLGDVASYQYDAFIISPIAIRARWDILGDVYTGGDIIEASGPATNRGDFFMSFRNGYGNLGNGSAGLLKLAGNVEIKFDRLVDTGGSGGGNSISRASSGTNYAYITGGIIESFDSSGASLIKAADTTLDTQIYFKGVTIKGPAGFDTIYATNLHPLVLENCTIIPGANSTNWARGQITSGIRINGTLGLSTFKPSAANITISGNASVGNLNLGMVTPSRVLMSSSVGSATNVTSSSASTHYLHPDGTSDAGPAGASSVGVTGSVQFNEAGGFFGTNEFLFEKANGALIISNSSASVLVVKGNNVQGEVRATSGGSMIVGTTNGAALGFKSYDTNRWGIRATTSGTLSPGDFYPAHAGLSIGPNWGANDTQIKQINSETFRGGVYSNSVYSIPGDTSVVTVYGTNQFWRLNVTSNLTFADSALSSNVVYWVKVTNNTSTVAFPGSWRWLSGPSLTTAPSLQTGEYIVRVQKFDDATNAWIETGPTYSIAAGPGLALTTNAGVITINQNTFQTLAYSTFTNCIFNMSSGYNGNLTMTNNVLFGQPTNLRAGADFKIYIAQDTVGTWNWWFDTNYWVFNVFPYLPVVTNANHVSVLSGFVNPAGTKLIVMQATDFRP